MNDEDNSIGKFGKLEDGPGCFFCGALWFGSNVQFVFWADKKEIQSVVTDAEWILHSDTELKEQAMRFIDGEIASGRLEPRIRAGQTGVSDSLNIEHVYIFGEGEIVEIRFSSTLPELIAPPSNSPISIVVLLEKDQGFLSLDLEGGD